MAGTVIAVSRSPTHTMSKPIAESIPKSETGFYETGRVDRDWERQIHDYYQVPPYW